jgi:hypothetical protein
MNDPGNLFKRLLLWLSGAPEEVGPGQAQPTAVGPPAPVRTPPATAPGVIGTPPAPADRPPEAVPHAAVALGDEPINDATDYGVAVESADVPANTLYWRAVRIHHLTPDENHGNHHIYLDALDEAGSRVFGARAHVTWEGGEQTIAVDKPLNEPGTNFPMWKWQVCAVEMLDLPSDRVVNLHTGHPDEPPGTGNTLFHHSFAVDFRRTLSAAPEPASSVLSGVVSNGDGRTLLLTRDGETVNSLLLDTGGAYRFETLAAGTYVLAVEGTDVRSAPVSLDGTGSATMNLEVPDGPPPDKFVEHFLLFGPPESSRTVVHLKAAGRYLMEQRPTFGFRAQDASRARHVILIGAPEDISQETEQSLQQAGCQVRRIQGTPEEIAAALQAPPN